MLNIAGRYWVKVGVEVVYPSTVKLQCKAHKSEKRKRNANKLAWYLTFYPVQRANFHAVPNQTSMMCHHPSMMLSQAR